MIISTWQHLKSAASIINKWKILIAQSFLLILPITSQAESESSTTINKVSIGANHACILHTDGTVQCWGGNEFGQLGDGTTKDRDTPVVVKNISKFTDISVGDHYSCGVIADGSVKCWGYNEFGQLGDGTTENRNVPVTVGGINGASTISSSEGYNCVVLQNSTIQCWGSRKGIKEDPETVAGISTAIAVAAGRSPCALLVNGNIQCWGDNESGQLGNGTTKDSNQPVDVQDIKNATAVITGADFACALISNDIVKCWGDGSIGQLGPLPFPDPDQTYRATPVAVSNISGALQIESAIIHSCAVISDGAVKCWGFLNEGSLMPQGNCRERIDSDDPVTIAGITNATAVAVGDSYFCAILKDGAVQCWGSLNSIRDDGEYSTIIDQCSPTHIPLTEPRATASRFQHLLQRLTLFLKASIQHL